MPGQDLRRPSFVCHNTPGLSSRSMFYYIQSCGLFYCKESYITDRSNFNSFLLLYTTGGRGYLTYRGKQQTLGQGQLFLIDCMEPQLYRTDPGELWEFKYLHFNGSESRKYFERFAENGDFVHTPGSGSIISSNIDIIIQMLRNKDRTLDIQGSCLIVEILTELLLAKGLGANPEILPDYMTAAINLIETGYADKLNLDSIARRLNINKFYLTRQFRRFTGKSLYEYLTGYRLNQAKYLLRSTGLPVGEISEKVGFESTSHFIKVFREHEDITPNRFRRYGG